MHIRRLEKKDLPQLANLYAQFWNEESDVSKREEAYDLIESEGNHIVLVAAEPRKTEEMLAVFTKATDFRQIRQGTRRNCKEMIQ